MNELELQSKTIDWLRFPLSVLVIFIHVSPDVNIQSIDYLHLNFHSWYDIIGTIISKVAGEIAVPCFFMFSGFWFFNKLKEWNKTVYFKKVKTRLRTLVLPYILFNLLVIIINALTRILKADGSIYPYLNELLANWYRIFWNYTSWWDVDNYNILGQQLLSMKYGPYVMSLWFLRDLIVMVFISPIVYYFVKYAKIWGLVILFFFYYTKIWIEIPGYSSRLFLTAFFFFTIGAFFSINRKNIVISLRKYQIIWLVVALITMFLSAFFFNTVHCKFFFPIFILSGVISVVNIASYFMERGKLQVRETLSKASFFIYCAHTILILNFTKIVFQKILGVDSTISLFATYFTVPFVCAGLILCIYLLMSRFTPRLLSLLTGSR